MTIIPENKLENKLKTKRLEKLMGEDYYTLRKDAKEVLKEIDFCDSLIKD